MAPGGEPGRGESGRGGPGGEPGRGEPPRAKSSGAPPSVLPGEDLSYDPGEERYWERGSLRSELDRVFDICHGCRMCFK